MNHTKESLPLFDSAAADVGSTGVVVHLSRFVDIMSVGVIPKEFVQGALKVQLHGARDILKKHEVLLVLRAGCPVQGCESIPAIDIEFVAVGVDEDKELLANSIDLFEQGLPSDMPSIVVRSEYKSDASSKKHSPEEENPVFVHDFTEASGDAAETVFHLQEMSPSALEDFVRLQQDGSIGLVAGARSTFISTVPGRVLTMENLRKMFREHVQRPVSSIEFLLAARGVLEESAEYEPSEINKWFDYLEPIVGGDRAAGEYDLSDSVSESSSQNSTVDRHRLLLRALGGLSRCVKIDLRTVDNFIEAHTPFVGDTVASLMRGMAIWSQGGYGSLIGVCKTHTDLYRIASCISAGQASRVEFKTEVGFTGGRISVDGHILQFFSEAVGQKSEKMKLLDQLIVGLESCDFRIVNKDPMRCAVTISTVDGKSRLKAVVTSEDSTEDGANTRINFSLELDIHRKENQKAWPVSFLRACLKSPMRSRIGTHPEFDNTLCLYRDQLAQTCDVGEIQDHVSALLNDEALIQNIWHGE